MQVVPTYTVLLDTKSVVFLVSCEESRSASEQDHDKIMYDGKGQGRKGTQNLDAWQKTLPIWSL